MWRGADMMATYILFMIGVLVWVLFFFVGVDLGLLCKPSWRTRVGGILQKLWLIGVLMTVSSVTPGTYVTQWYALTWLGLATFAVLLWWLAIEPWSMTRYWDEHE